MSLPFILSPGLMSIYNVKQTGVNGIEAPPKYNFGTITKSWRSDLFPPYVGDSVMFKGDDLIKLVYDNITYSIVEEQNIKLIELLPP